MYFLSSATTEYENHVKVKMKSTRTERRKKVDFEREATRCLRLQLDTKLEDENFVNDGELKNKLRIEIGNYRLECDCLTCDCV